MAYIYGSGLYYKKTSMQVDDLLLIHTTEGWSGHLSQGNDPDIIFEHQGLGTILPGEGLDYASPRTIRIAAADEAKEIFRLSEVHRDTIWQCFPSVVRAQGHLKHYMAIPSSDTGVDLGNEVDGSYNQTLAVQPSYGFQYYGWQTLRGKETDIGSWFQLPNQRVEFAYKCPRAGPPVGNVTPRWIIRPIVVRHLNPILPDDAQILFDAMTGDGMYVNPERVIKYTHKRFPLPLTNAVSGVWGIQTFSWDGFDGHIKGLGGRDAAGQPIPTRLSQIAAAGQNPRRFAMAGAPALPGRFQ